MVVNYFNRVALSVISIKTLNPSISFGYFFACSHVMAYIYIRDVWRKAARARHENTYLGRVLSRVEGKSFIYPNKDRHRSTPLQTMVT